MAPSGVHSRTADNVLQWIHFCHELSHVGLRQLNECLNNWCTLAVKWAMTETNPLYTRYMPFQST